MSSGEERATPTFKEEEKITGKSHVLNIPTKEREKVTGKKRERKDIFEQSEREENEEKKEYRERRAKAFTAFLKKL